MPRRAAAKLAERMRKGLGPAQVAAPAEAPSTRSPWSLATRPRGRSPLVPAVAHHSPSTLPPPPPDVASPISRLALGITPSATERRLPGVGEESPGADSLGEESPGADSPGEDSPETQHGGDDHGMLTGAAVSLTALLQELADSKSTPTSAGAARDAEPPSLVDKYSDSDDEGPAGVPPPPPPEVEDTATPSPSALPPPSPAAGCLLRDEVSTHTRPSGLPHLVRDTRCASKVISPVCAERLRVQGGLSETGILALEISADVKAELARQVRRVYLEGGSELANLLLREKRTRKTKRASGGEHVGEGDDEDEDEDSPLLDATTIDALGKLVHIDSLDPRRTDLYSALHADWRLWARTMPSAIFDGDDDAALGSHRDLLDAIFEMALCLGAQTAFHGVVIDVLNHLCVNIEPPETLLVPTAPFQPKQHCTLPSTPAFVHSDPHPPLGSPSITGLHQQRSARCVGDVRRDYTVVAGPAHERRH